MRFRILRSGSSGNCSLIEHDNTRVLLDAGGKSLRGLIGILGETGLTPDKLDGIIITHLHSDHCNRSTLGLCKKFEVPLFIHENNLLRLRELFGELADDTQVKAFTEAQFEVGDLEFESFQVSHDAPVVTSGFRFWQPENPLQFITYASDLGCFPDELVNHFKGASHIILESNHDTELLWKNPNRPWLHKKRVAGPGGHLSNEQNADALLRILKGSAVPTESIILCHLSEDHNSPQQAIDYVGNVLDHEGFTPSLVAAPRNCAMEFFEM